MYLSQLPAEVKPPKEWGSTLMGTPKIQPRPPATATSPEIEKALQGKSFKKRRRSRRKPGM